MNVTDPALIAEQAANQVVNFHGLPQENQEPGLQALGHAMGVSISYELAQTELVAATLRLVATAQLTVVDTALLADLVEAKIELLSEHKLDYPQDYDEESTAAMQAEISKLQILSSSLTVPDTTTNADPGPACGENTIDRRQE